MKILVINPGGTSTKIAVFEDDKQLFKTNITHTCLLYTSPSPRDA